MKSPAVNPAAARPRAGLAVAGELASTSSATAARVIGLVVFALMVLLAIFAPLIAPHDPTMQYRDAMLVPPIWTEGGRPGFLLGTDALGRDILSRLIYGARYSLVIGLVVVTLALISGILVGLVAGYFGGWVDALIMRVMDIILAFPSLLLALVLVAILGPGPLQRHAGDRAWCCSRISPG